MTARKPYPIPTRFSPLLLCAMALGLGACGGGNEQAPGAGSATGAQANAAPASAPSEAASPVDSRISDAPSEAPGARALGRAETFAGQGNESSSGSTLEPVPEQAAIKAPTATTARAHALGESISAESGLSAVLIYVSTVGNNAWSGQLSAPNAGNTDGPVKTIAAAQAIARTRLAAMKAGSAPRQPVRVLIAAGNYPIASTLQFSPADSGTSDAPVSYEAMVAGTVTISGGVPLATTVPTAAGVPVSLPGYTFDALGVRGGGQLFINGKRMTLARQPNIDKAWFVQKAVPLASEPVNKQGREAFEPTTEAMAWINSLSADDRARAIIGVMQSWSGGHHRLSSQATPAGSVRIQPAALAAFLSFGLSQRYYIENVAAAFDAPGEWLPTLQGVRYIPTSAEVGQTLQPMLPVLDRLVSVRGDIANQAWVQHLQFKGLGFAYTRSITPDSGYSDNQAAVEVGAAIEVDGATNVKIDGCTISRTANYGVWFRQSVRDSSITNSVMTDLGAGGIKVGLAYQRTNEALITGNNLASGNRISETGKVYPGAVGVWLGQTFDNKVSNNAIFNTTYTGISVGWSWGYEAATSGRNLIADNLLVNIGQGTLSDMGGIYTVGVSPGTRITGNVVREVRGYPNYGAGAWGIYNDEGASQVVVENNVVIGTDSGGYHLNYGRSNTVVRNVFAKGTKYEMRVSRTDPGYTNLVTDANVMLPVVKQSFDQYASSPDVLFTANQVSDKLSTAGVDLSKCGSGCAVVPITMTTAADPRVVSLSGTDVTTATRISATAMKAGPLDQGVRPAVEVDYAAPAVVVAPPVNLAIDIANSNVGTQPKGMTYAPQGNTSAIGVVSRDDAPRGKCLAFNDNPNYRYVYEPYAYATLNHSSGTSRGDVSMILDANSDLIYEWRDDGNPYKTGPALQLNANGIYVKGKRLGPAPIGSWFTVSVISEVANSAATWSLQVVTSTGTQTYNGLAFGTTGWSKLSWVGLISNSAKSSTACFSTIKVTNMH